MMSSPGHVWNLIGQISEISKRRRRNRPIPVPRAWRVEVLRGVSVKRKDISEAPGEGGEKVEKCERLRKRG